MEALKKSSDKKPEKVVLYSSYLPVGDKLTENKTVNEVDSDFDDEPFEFDDDDDKDDDSSNEGGFAYYWELLMSLVQLAWGALVALVTKNGS